MRELAFWKKRSENFNNLEWVNDKGYLNAFVDKCNLSKQDTVLDVGTGTGKIASAVYPFVKQVIGMDISPDMLAKGNWNHEKAFVLWDIRKQLFQENYFDKITARSVLHHITRGTKKALRECYEILKPGGRIIVSEGIPPSKNTVKYYKKIFKLKEKRILFTDGMLEKMISRVGFENVETSTYFIRQSSVKNWLENSGIPKKNQEKIMNIYKNNEELRKAHNMTLKEDCLIDVKTVIITAQKSV